MRRLLAVVVTGFLVFGVPQSVGAHSARGIRARVINTSVNEQANRTILWGRFRITNSRFRPVRVRCWFQFNVRFQNSLTGERRTYSKLRAWKFGPATLDARTRYRRTGIRKTAVAHPSLAELGEGWERDFEWITMPHCHVA
jgi:hypothetical protein